VNPSYRCSAHSTGLAEPLAGTASTVRAFLLLECPGPWGEDALRESRLPPDLAAELERRCAAARVRPLLVRRHGRTPGGMHCFAAYAGAGRPWTEATALHHVEDVLGLDLQRLGRGESLGLPAHHDPLFLVCTHGRHDVCCAEQGRPLAAALSTTYPKQTWECSHIGGDRFAGNLLVLPDGLYYGRADRETGPRIAKLHQEGQLDLEHLRGRTAYGFAVQAAEWHLRRSLQETALDRVRLTRRHVDGDVTEAEFAVGDDRWLVRVRTGRGAPFQLTCRLPRQHRPPRFELLDVRPAEETQ
jgi:hypothetical protein